MDRASSLNHSSISIFSSGGRESSKAFTDGMLKIALRSLPLEQAKTVRRLAKRLNKRSGIGYFASLDVVARVGDFLADYPSSRIKITS